MRTSGILLLLLCYAHGDDQKMEPIRFKFEILYTIHKNVRTDAALQRVEDLFRKTWPDLDLSRIEPSARDMSDYFAIYRDRLLEQEGTSWKKVLGDFEKSPRPPEERDDSGRRLFAYAFEIAKDQVIRELKVRSMYR